MTHLSIQRLLKFVISGFQFNYKLIILNIFFSIVFFFFFKKLLGEISINYNFNFFWLKSYHLIIGSIGLGSFLIFLLNLFVKINQNLLKIFTTIFIFISLLMILNFEFSLFLLLLSILASIFFLILNIKAKLLN